MALESNPESDDEMLEKKSWQRTWQGGKTVLAFCQSGSDFDSNVIFVNFSKYCFLDA